jgi:hypothetical protein
MDVYNGTYTDTIGREQGYPEVFLQRNADTTEAQRIVFEKAYKKGVTLLYGTDAAVLPHDMGGWQFAIMVERGMTPMDAIRVGHISRGGSIWVWPLRWAPLRPGRSSRSDCHSRAIRLRILRPCVRLM